MIAFVNYVITFSQLLTRSLILSRKVTFETNQIYFMTQKMPMGLSFYSPCSTKQSKIGCSALWIRDYCQNVLPMRFRESQSSYFGKKGMSLHADVFLMK